MSKINVFNCMITGDHTSQKIYVASTKLDEIIIPTTIITQPKFLSNEIRYNIKNLFSKNSIKFLEEIVVSFLDIQNDILLNLIEKSENYTSLSSNDINLLCGVILHDKILSDQLHWISIPNFIQNNFNQKNNQNTEAMPVIRYVFDRMII